MAPAGPNSVDRFDVPAWLDCLGWAVERYPRFWKALGKLEGEMLREKLDKYPIEQPIYIAGLARAGSTILLELLAQHPDVSTHRYRDFPVLDAPWLWNAFVDRAATRTQDGKERAHDDGIVVTAESPEAFEEPLWMRFFPHAHDPAWSNVLGRETENPAFESSYKEHIRKLLFLRNGRRYLAKNNYNVSRLNYLLKLFPDARILLPIRDPLWHVASLMKQHDLLCRKGRRSPRGRRYMKRAGHFEFGLDRRQINMGDTATLETITALWNAGQDVEAWARYWTAVYSYVATRLEQDADLAAAVQIVRFEDLCDAPHDMMRGILAHLGLSEAGLTERALATLRRPTYYALPFTSEDEQLVRECTAATAQRFGCSGRLPEARP